MATLRVEVLLARFRELVGLLEGLGFSLRDVARLSGVSVSSLSRWLRGERVPLRALLERVVERLEGLAGTTETSCFYRHFMVKRVKPSYYLI